MAKKANPIPDFGDVRNKRAVIIGVVSTTVGVVVAVPLYNAFLAPWVTRGITSLRTAGFLPSSQ